MKFNLPYLQFEVKHKLITKQDFVNNLESFLLELTIPQQSALAIANALYARMSDENLFYHTPVHVLCMFQFAQEYSINLSKAQQLAIWFHDSIYVPNAPYENEENSSLFLHSMLSSFLKTQELKEILKEAEAIVNATAYHLESLYASNIPGAELVLDLDLCSFSFDYPIYDYVGTLIRKECPTISDLEFEKGRRNFLNKLKEKGFIFRTKYFLENFESKALENLSKTLDKN